MPNTAEPSYETLLRLCAESAPRPWYPRAYAQSSGAPRDSLDAPLNDLRIGGLIQLTDWEPATGQGYVLTELGVETLNSPSLLEQFKKGSLPPGSAEAAPAETADGSAPTVFERGEMARAAYYFPEASRAMTVLLILNILSFALSVVAALQMGKPFREVFFEGNPEALHAVGALEAKDLLRGEWWRLLSCCFLHFGLLHLCMNMYALYVSAQLEALWGGVRFVIIYLFSALGGSCAAMIYQPGTPTEPILVAGASGALWGLMASLGAWMLMNRRHLPPQEAAAWVRRYGTVVLMNLLVSTLPNVSASAHFGGGAVGFLTATLLYFHRFSAPSRRTGIVLLIATLPMICLMGLMEVMEKDPRWQLLAQAEDASNQRQGQARFEAMIPAIDAALVDYEALDKELEVEFAAEPQKIDRWQLVEQLDKSIEAVGGLHKKLDAAPRTHRSEPARIAQELLESMLEYSRRCRDWLTAAQPLSPEEQLARQKLRKRWVQGAGEWSAAKSTVK